LDLEADLAWKRISHGGDSVTVNDPQQQDARGQAMRELNRRAVRASVDVVRRVTLDDLGRATPCAAWTLADLLVHMITQHYGFAAAAQGDGANPSAWEARSLGDDPVAAYVAAAEHVMAAFAEDDVLERAFALPEISPTMTFPPAQAISFHFVDYVVHSWDVARALGASVDFEPGPAGGRVDGGAGGPRQRTTAPARRRLPARTGSP